MPINPYKRHLRWEPTGRTYEKLDELGNPTGQNIWAGKIGEEQIQDNNGDWQPYIYDTDSNELRYSKNDQRVEFSSGKQIIKNAGNKLIESLKLFVQREIDGEWVNQPHGLPTRQIRHNKRFRHKEIVDEDGYCLAWLEFPDAQYDLQIGIQAGRSKKSVMGFRFRAPISANVRMQIVKDGIEDAGNYSLIRVTVGEETRVVGIKWRDFTWKWTYQEAGKRTVSIEDSISYPGKKKATITVGPIAYNANEWIDEVPDTWGLIDNVDDCHEAARTTYVDSEGVYSDIRQGCNYTNRYESGLTWTNVTAAGTAENGCYIQIDVRSVQNSGNEAGRLYTVDTRSVTAWSQAYRPYTDTPKHANYVNWFEASVGPQDSPEIKTIIQDRFDDDHASGDDIGIVWIEPTTTQTDRIFYESLETGGGNPAALYIVYTTGGGVEVSAGVDPLIITEYNPNVNKAINFTAGVDALAITEYNPTVNKAINLTADVDALTITEYNPTVNKAINVSAGFDALTITEYNPTVTVAAGVEVLAGVDELAITEYNPTINKAINVAAGVDVLTITDHNPTVQLNINVAADVDVLTITEYDATIKLDISFIAALDTLVITDYNPTILAGELPVGRASTAFTSAGPGMGFTSRKPNITFSN